MFDSLPSEAELHLWVLQMNFSSLLPEHLTSCLDAAEVERANRFRFTADWYRYTACRAMLRVALGRYLGVLPESIGFGTAEHGKPFLTRPRNVKVSFNVSHSGVLGAMVFATSEPVGVDVEQMRSDIDVLDLAHVCLSDHEMQQFAAAEASDRIGVFFRYWTGKEAWIKADGRGLSLPIRDYTLTPTADSSYRISPQHIRPWTIMPIDTLPGYAAAVAAPGNWFLRRTNLDPAFLESS